MNSALLNRYFANIKRCHCYVSGALPMVRADSAMLRGAEVELSNIQ